MKGNLGLLLFVFFVIVLILMLTGRHILQFLRNRREAAQQAADQKAQRHREETGRQRQQYNHRQQPQPQGNRQADEEEHIDNPFYNSQGKPSGSGGQPTPDDEPRRTQTATGETIIDHRHQKRENNKIFDDSDGEYTDFVEVKGEE